MDMGLMQCAIGDGKGKTTALIGQLVRAQGQGFKCVCFQFLKTQPSGECAALEQLGIEKINGALLDLGAAGAIDPRGARCALR